MDAEFIDKTRYSWEEYLKTNPDIKTAEEMMSVLYKTARDKILGLRQEE